MESFPFCELRSLGQKTTDDEINKDRVEKMHSNFYFLMHEHMNPSSKKNSTCTGSGTDFEQHPGGPYFMTAMFCHSAGV